MIGKLRGIVDSVTEDHLILDVNGVGYLVFSPSRVLQQLQDIKGEVSLVIETHVREDHIHLYGFLTEEERGWFKLLMTVQGVGAKMAMAILSALPTHEIENAIAAQDVTTLTRANGVGKKLAERLVVELKSKVPAFSTVAMQVITPAAKGKKTSVTPSVREDAVSALVNLGYRRAEAFGAVAAAARRLGDGAALDALIRGGLQELGSGHSQGAMR